MFFQYYPCNKSKLQICAWYFTVFQLEDLLWSCMTRLHCRFVCIHCDSVGYLKLWQGSTDHSVSRIQILDSAFRANLFPTFGFVWTNTTTNVRKRSERKMPQTIKVSIKSSLNFCNAVLSKCARLHLSRRLFFFTYWKL